MYVGMLFSGYLKWEVLGAWMTFKKAEIAKTLENGLSMIETNFLKHNWSHFVILSGLKLHQFQKKLLLREKIFSVSVGLANLVHGSSAHFANRVKWISSKIGLQFLWC